MPVPISKRRRSGKGNSLAERLLWSSRPTVSRAWRAAANTRTVNRRVSLGLVHVVNSPDLSWPINAAITFSRTLMRLKIRMFWNVAGNTQPGNLIGARTRLTSLPSRSTRPESGAIDAGNDIDQRSLARAIGANQPTDRPSPEMQIDTMQGLQFTESSC